MFTTSMQIYITSRDPGTLMGCRILCAHSCRHGRCAWGAWRRKEAAKQLGRQMSHGYETLTDDGLQKLSRTSHSTNYGYDRRSAPGHRFE
eukprot:6220025-Pyramimonas_sp.AAC.1